jgi:hypothetical protein
MRASMMAAIRGALVVAALLGTASLSSAQQTKTPPDTTKPATKNVAPPATKTVAPPATKVSAPAVTQAAPTKTVPVAPAPTQQNKTQAPAQQTKSVAPAQQQKVAPPPVQQPKPAPPTATQAKSVVPPQTKAAVPPAQQPKTAAPAQNKVVPPAQNKAVTPPAQNKTAAPTQNKTATPPNKAAPAPQQTKAAPPPVVQNKTAQPPAGQTKAPAGQTKTPAVTNATPPQRRLNVVTTDTALVKPLVIMREVFTYDDAGRRDPFLSLLTTNDLRPTITDLRLVMTVVDEPGRSVALLMDNNERKQKTVTVGMKLGRMRVVSIKSNVVVFAIEEFGTNRRDSLLLRDSTKVRGR